MSEQAPAIVGIAALRAPGPSIDFLRVPEGDELCLLRPRP